MKAKSQTNGAEQTGTEFQVAEHKRRVKENRAALTAEAPAIEPDVEFVTLRSDPVGQFINIDQMIPSPTNPRKRFPDTSIVDLTRSIADQGVIEPLIVRQLNDGKYEIVCGERRWRAAKNGLRNVKTNLKPSPGSPMADAKDKFESLPCIVRDLTDEQVLDIQIHENLHREDVAPMDEAYGYKFLKEKLECTFTELSLRVGKSESYVLNRLKFNQLVDEAQKDIEDGFLPLTYALEIAKYAPDAQKLILENAVYRTVQEYINGKYSIRLHKESLKGFAEMVTWIAQNVVWQLSKSIFDKKATNLRKDGLACINCPDRTGANASLFDADLIGKKDSCLSPKCYQAKTQAHITGLRAKLAADACIEPEQVPFVKTWSWSGGKGYLGLDKFTVLSGKRAKVNTSCDRSIRAIDLENDSYGQVVDICLKSSGCLTHYPEAERLTNDGVTNSGKPKLSAEETREAELDDKRQRKEELFDVKVGEAVRYQVFVRAADKFASNASYHNLGDAFLPWLLAKLWATSNNGDDNYTRNQIIQRAMESAMDVERGHLGFTSYDAAKNVTEIARISERHQLRMLFLFTHGNKGAMYFGHYKSQKLVKALAEEYDIDYQLVDAEVRLDLCAKKHKSAFEAYLSEIKTGNRETSVPRQFTWSYKPKDQEI